MTGPIAPHPGQPLPPRPGTLYAAPVIPGPDGARRPAAIGQPGHLERLMGDAPSKSWPLSERAGDITR